MRCPGFPYLLLEEPEPLTEGREVYPLWCLTIAKEGSSQTRANCLNRFDDFRGLWSVLFLGFCFYAAGEVVDRLLHAIEGDLPFFAGLLLDLFQEFVHTLQVNPASTLL